MASPNKARNTLIHARQWISSESNAGWAVAGVYLAIKELEKAQRTFYTNAAHRSSRCTQCLAIATVASFMNDIKAVANG